MGGKSSTQTSQVSIPPEVLAEYNTVNSLAQQTAQTPFQQYGGQFVAPINSEQQAGISATNAYANAAQPYYNAATETALGAYGSAQPYYQAATGQVQQAAGTGQTLNGASLGTLNQAQQQGQAGLGAALGAYGQGYANAQPYNASATGALGAGLGQAANANATAGSGYVGAYQGAQPYNQAAATGIGAAANTGSAYNAAAGQGLGAALQGASPYNAAAGAYDVGGGQAVNAQQIGQGQINQFESPYINDVTQSQLALLNQQNQEAQSGQTGTAIQSGAFGGDRTGIAAANLQQQQDLATNSILANSLNSAYSQALGAAQQQQGVNLGAAQANRAALQQTGSALQGLGAQAYGQGTGTAEDIASLGNQAYSQGLGAATALQGLGQQQYAQGSGTASNIANLGQQEYSQGLGASGQLQSLGQTQYAQGEGLGQNLQSAASQGYTQGANTAAQQAAIGNQAFNQGITAAGENATLGSNLFNLGSETSQNLANLGTGAQSAGLAGAQAQQAAGATQQQTQQAQDTALYNQFLQQQSYPFQVDQFLANIAEGTGALSGSTTTTTQPGSLFNAGGRVGKAGGGGLAYDPQLAAELLQAQAGMYGPYGASGSGASPATGGLYGGLAGRVPAANLPVQHLMTSNVQPRQQISPLQAIAQAGSAAKGGGELWDDGKKLWDKTGLGAGSGPGDISGQVPNAPVAEGVGAADPTLDQYMRRGGRIHRDTGGAIDPYGQASGLTLNIPDDENDRKLETANTPAKTNSDNPLLQGLGAVGAASGAVTGLGNLGALVTGTSGLAGASGAGFFANVLPLLLKSGGAVRKGYAGAGAVDGDQSDDAGDSDSLLDKIFQTRARGFTPTPAAPPAPKKPDIWQQTWDSGAPSRQAVNDVASKAYNDQLQARGYGSSADATPLQQGTWANLQAPANPHRQSAPPSAAPATLTPGQDFSMAENPQPALPHSDAVSPDPDEPLGLAAAALSGAPDPGFSQAGLAAMSGGPGAPAPAPGSPAAGLAGAPPAAGDKATGLAPAPTKAPPPQTPAAAQAVATAPTAQNGGLGKIQDVVEHIKNAAEQYGSNLMHGYKDSWIPLLTGLAAFTAAPTRNFGTALAQGLGAGAASVMPLQQQEANVAKTQAETGRTQAVTSGELLANARAGQQLLMSGMYTRVDNPNGYFWDPQLKVHYDVQPKGAGAVPAGKFEPKYLNQTSSPFVQQSVQNTRALMSAAGPNDTTWMTKSEPAIQKVQDEGTSAQTSTYNALLPMAESVASLREGTQLQTGAGNQIMSNIRRNFEYLMGLTGQHVDSNGYSAQEMLNKLGTVQAGALTNDADQRAYAALKEYLGTVPSGQLAPETNRQLTSKLMAANQERIDRMNYYNEFGTANQLMGNLPTNRAFDANQAELGFRAQTHGGGVYEEEGKQLAGLMANPHFADALKYLSDPSDPVKQQGARDWLQMHTRNNPALMRYFTGGNL